MSRRNNSKRSVQTPVQMAEPVEVQEPVTTEEELMEVVPEEELVEVVPEDAMEEVPKEELPVAEELVESAETGPEPVEEQPVQEEVPVKQAEEKIETKPTKGVLIVEKNARAMTVRTKVIPKEVEKFNAITDQYIAIMKKDVIGEEDRKKAISLLVIIIQNVLASTDVRIFDAFYQFMLKNRSVMLVPSVVTDGLYKYCDKGKIVKIMQTYVVFQSLVESQLLKSRFTLNATAIRRTLNNDALTNWLIMKRQ